MNTRLYNLAAAAPSRKPSTGQKRHKTGHNSHYRVPVDDDFGTIRWREEAVNFCGHVVTTARESLRDDAYWATCESWLPEDNTDYGLGKESGWFDDDEEECRHIVIEPPLSAPSGQKRRSVVSVGTLFLLKSCFSTFYRVDHMLFGWRSTGMRT